LVGALQEWEDKTAANIREDEYQQRILAGSYGTADHLLYWRLFDPDNIPGETRNDNYVPGLGEIIQPTTMDEFEAMLAEWEAEDAGFRLEEVPD
jgi:hypothetical protein